MIKHQKKLIIILGIIAVVFAIGYFAVLTPILNYLNREPEVEPVELLPGEVLDSTDRILLFEHLEKAYIKSVEITNSAGTWAMVRDEGGDFYIKDHPSVPYDSSELSSLVVSAGYTLSLERVTMNCTDMSEYGLDEESRIGSYTVTSTDDVAHTVYIGAQIPTGGGYYCAYKDRAAVYVLSTDLVSSLLTSVNDMVYPILTYPTGTNDYYLIRDFFIMHGDDMYVWIDYNADGKVIDKPTNSTYIMNYPGSYVTNTTNYASAIEVFKEFSGLYVVEIGTDLSNFYSTDEELAEAEEKVEETLYPDGEKPDEGTVEYMCETIRQIRIMSYLVFGKETLEKYGLLTPAYSLHYNYNDVDSYVLFSAANEDGSMYAYSSVWNTIVLVDSSTVEFLDWELLSYVDKPLFMLSIADIDTIELDGFDFSESFKLTGESEGLTVTPASTGVGFDEFYIYNFRQFYKSMLTLEIQDYADSTDENPEDLIFTLRFTTRAGKVYEYKFYRYSTRRCFYTVNGEGEFYVLYDMVEKVVSDCQKVLAGLDVDSWAKS